MGPRAHKKAESWPPAHIRKPNLVKPNPKKMPVPPLMFRHKKTEFSKAERTRKPNLENRTHKKAKSTLFAHAHAHVHGHGHGHGNGIG